MMVVVESQWRFSPHDPFRKGLPSPPRLCPVSSTPVFPRAMGEPLAGQIHSHRAPFHTNAAQVAVANVNIAAASPSISYS